MELVSPWCKNGNIKVYIDQHKPDEDTRLKLVRLSYMYLDTTEYTNLGAVAQLRGVASGLKYLHGRRPPVCHGDIKVVRTIVEEAGIWLTASFSLVSASGKRFSRG